jgi:signal transduction histidine kinase
MREQKAWPMCWSLPIIRNNEYRVTEEDFMLKLFIVALRRLSKNLYILSMKFGLLTLLFLRLFLISGYSQQRVPWGYHIDSIPSNGIELDQGWKFSPGDDTAWAKPGFDDKNWKTVDLSAFKTEILPDLKGKNIGWLRTRIYFDSSIRNNSMALVINQLGASIIYVDGSPLVSLGKINPYGYSQPSNPHGKPFLLQGNLGSDTISLAIRYASQFPSLVWFQKKKSKLIDIRISPWPIALNEFQQSLIEPRPQLALSFVAITLGLLFLSLYTFFISEKINVLFAGFCFALALSMAVNYQLEQANMDLNAFAWMNLASNFIDKLIGVAVLSLMAMAVLGRITTFQLCLFLYMMVVDTILEIYFGGSLFQKIQNDILRVVFTYELCRITILGFIRSKYFMGVIGVTSSLVNIFYFINKSLPPHFYDDYLRFNLFFNFIMFTLYVAYNYASNSRKLLLQIAHNKRLSEEKHQILLQQNTTLEHQVSERTAELSQSLQDLRDAQAQLIQSEKMASLGELTAGIAHEIQNPLNFVNNFAEVNTELIDEMEGELKAGNPEAAEKIAGSIRQNLDKISHHGKRADAIVKGMLLHSRSSSEQKEPTDINSLADEYFRLSYHGLRAKDKMFNATMSQELDPRLGLASVVAPDIGRALLNLFNNAFYSVSEKKKRLGDGYEPKVSLSTMKQTGKIQIIVYDNGLGISAKLVDKIFNPFFTSKPAGQGTGLGLSMSYDIITKEHGGSLSVKTMEGEYAQFLIELPVPDQG